MSSPTSQAAARRDLTWNTNLYFTYIGILAFTGAFGDMMVVVPSLAMRLHAPDWVVVLPTVSATGIAYLPILLVGWLFRQDISRKKAYAATCLAMFLPLLILIFALVFGRAPSGMVTALTVACLLFALGQGLSVLPCWDLYARIFPGEVRGLIMGRAAGLNQFITVFSAAGAAWLISNNSVLDFPLNYALGLTILLTGGLIAVGLVLLFREARYPGPCAVPPFSAYLAQLRGIYAGNPAFRQVILGAVFGSVIVGVMPLLLIYAREHRGFQEGHVSLLVFARPFVFIPLAILFGQLSARIGPKRVVAMAAGLMALGTALMPCFSGPWVVAPLLLGACALFTYSFSVVAVMNLAEEGKTHLYLTLMYVAVTLPALMPLLLSRIIRPWPTFTLGLLATLGVGCAIVFLVADRTMRRQTTAAPAPQEA